MKPDLEKQVVRMITSGLKISQVANRLHLQRGKVIEIKRANGLKREYGVRKRRTAAQRNNLNGRKPERQYQRGKLLYDKPGMESAYYLDRFIGF